MYTTVKQFQDVSNENFPHLPNETPIRETNREYQPTSTRIVQQSSQVPTFQSPVTEERINNELTTTEEATFECPSSQLRIFNATAESMRTCPTIDSMEEFHEKRRSAIRRAINRGNRRISPT